MNHTTLRGYNDTGFLRFTCRLMDHPTTDQAWIYCVEGHGKLRGRRNKTVTTSQFGVAVVVVQMLTRVSNKRFIRQNYIRMLFLSPLSTTQL